MGADRPAGGPTVHPATPQAAIHPPPPYQWDHYILGTTGQPITPFPIQSSKAPDIEMEDSENWESVKINTARGRLSTYSNRFFHGGGVVYCIVLLAG